VHNAARIRVDVPVPIPKVFRELHHLRFDLDGVEALDTGIARIVSAVMPDPNPMLATRRGASCSISGMRRA
jgi:hypothetical protein